MNHGIIQFACHIFHIWQFFSVRIVDGKTNPQKSLRNLELEIPLKFLFIGDWGSQQKISDSYSKTVGAPQFVYWNEKVAYAMSNYASSSKQSFLVALGDNFYDNGVASVTDALWQQLYTNVYSYNSLQIPWYVVLGDHDYGTSNKARGNVQAQIDYSTQHLDSRWNMDDHCYSKSWTLPASEDTLQIVFIDTTLIAPEVAYGTSSQFVSADIQQTRKTAMLSCLEEFLSASMSTWLLVAGHYPLYSSGVHSEGGIAAMIEALEKYFTKYQVDAYLSGHDHILEHLSGSFTFSKDTGGRVIDYFISGAASQPDAAFSDKKSDATSHFKAATAGFATAEVSSSTMTVRFMDADGNMLYETARTQSRVVNGTSTRHQRSSTKDRFSGSKIKEYSTNHMSKRAKRRILAMEFVAAGLFGALVLLGVIIAVKGGAMFPVAAEEAKSPSGSHGGSGTGTKGFEDASNKGLVDSTAEVRSKAINKHAIYGQLSNKERSGKRSAKGYTSSLDYSRDSVGSSAHALLDMKNIHEAMEI